MKKLLIVESPAKARAIKSYVPKDYEVMASVGHIRELASTGYGGFGVDINNNFKPTYEIEPDKQKVVKDLKKEAKDKEVIIATDPDREGEAIAWHLAEVLGLDLAESNRVEFKEITKETVLEELNNTRPIDMDLVKSQEARRIIDRIIGYKLSDLVKKKLKARSAGRVQSVALKLVVDLEKEIQSFVPEIYYDLKLKLDDFKFDYVPNKKGLIKEEEAKQIKKEATSPFKVSNIKTRVRTSKSNPAYITSTLQQDANNQLGFSAGRTMRAAQQLYEGIEINGEVYGLITYMRTDSNRLSPKFVYKAKAFIEKEYGKEYVGYYKTSTKDEAQDAHEAIRPTKIDVKPESIEKHLTKDQFKLYQLIYNRALESLMSNAKFDITEMILESNNHKFKAEGIKRTFKGFTIVRNNHKDKKLPNLKLGEEVEAKVSMRKNQTKPKARYTEASLIKELESLGIGRPSTYAHIMSTLRNRDYVKTRRRRFIPTDLGILVADKLDKFFSQIINTEYTSRLETVLDEISEGKRDKNNLLERFYVHFMKIFEYADKNMEKIPNEPTGEMCPKCGHPLEYKRGMYSEFIGCSNFPKCRYTENIDNGNSKQYKYKKKGSK